MVGGIAGLITGIYNTRQIPPPEVGERLSRRNNSTPWNLMTSTPIAVEF